MRLDRGGGGTVVGAETDLVERAADLLFEIRQGSSIGKDAVGARPLAVQWTLESLPLLDLLGRQPAIVPPTAPQLIRGGDEPEDGADPVQAHLQEQRHVQDEHGRAFAPVVVLHGGADLDLDAGVQESLESAQRGLVGEDPGGDRRPIRAPIPNEPRAEQFLQPTVCGGVGEGAVGEGIRIDDPSRTQSRDQSGDRTLPGTDSTEQADHGARAQHGRTPGPHGEGGGTSGPPRSQRPRDREYGGGGGAVKAVRRRGGRLPRLFSGTPRLTSVRSDCYAGAPRAGLGDGRAVERHNVRAASGRMSRRAACPDPRGSGAPSARPERAIEQTQRSLATPRRKDMTAPTENQAIYRATERGASAWPLVIALLLLAIMSYFWWAETDKVDKALADAKEATEAKVQEQLAHEKTLKYLEDLSRLVGFQDTSHSTPARTILATNLETLGAHVRPDGALAGGGKGALATLKEKATKSYTRAGRIHKSTVGVEKALDVSVLPQAFKQKLAEFRSKWSGGVGDRPVPPADEDDVQGMSEYRDNLATYEQRTAEYEAEFRDLTSDDAWKSIAETVRMPAEWAGETENVVVVDYLPLPEGGAHTVEALLAPLPAMVDSFKQEIDALQAAAANQITQLTGEVNARQTELDNTRAELAKTQTDTNAQIAQLRQSVTEQTESITRLQDERSTAQNELEQTKERHRGETSKLQADLTAHQAGLASMKERRDLRIRRDDPKGTVLAVSQALGTGTIDLGRQDRAYEGQVFVVSSLDRGGNRVDKGRVVITQVTGPSSSKVRILDGRGEVAGGDRLHNALYNPTDPVHVYIHGTLDKWPRELAMSRLKQLGVVVQDAIDGKTDYIVIPNSLAVKPDVAGGADEESEEDEGGAAASPLAQLESLARRNGAVIVPERLFDALLDY